MLLGVALSAVNSGQRAVAVVQRSMASGEFTFLFSAVSQENLQNARAASKEQYRRL